MICNGCEFRPDLHYDDQYQIWVRREPDGTLTIGMTDLSQTVAGKIMHVRVRKPGTPRPAGKPVATIESAKWAGPIPNVFDCVIEEINPRVLDEPSLLNRDPYGAWVARVRAADPDAALAGLVSGATAEAGYCTRCLKDEIHCERS